MSSVLLKRFEKVIDAEMARSFLQTHGIESFLRDEHTISIQPFYSNALGGVKLYVGEEDYEWAKDLMEQVEQEVLALPENYLEELACPHCHGHQVELSPPHRKGFALLIMYLISIPLPFLVTDSYVCHDCHHTWVEKKKTGILNILIPVFIVTLLSYLFYALLH